MKHKKLVSRSAQNSKHERPTIVLKPGKLPDAVDQAESALRGRCEELRIFQRGGELVRVVCLPERHEDRRLRRPRGSVQLEPLSSTTLTEVFSRIAKWKRINSKGHVQTVDCPPKISAFYLSRTGAWQVPVLKGIISAPILRKDGTILAQPGYDEKSGLLLVCDEDWPAIPEQPTRVDAIAALRTLLAPFVEFPFVAPEDRAVHVACILTAIQRRLLGACPIFGYSAPAQRSGKSLLAESVAIIATEKPAPATAISGEREEIRKMITSALCEGHSIINLDNVEHPLASPDLAKAITQSEYQDRALGKNQMLRLMTNVLWTATGNNLMFRRDLSSRALLCSIDPGVESPEARSFKIPELGNHIKNHRKDLVVAALTILRAYHVAGRPRQQVAAWGGFDDWSASIREPLVWLGLADPCKTRTTVLADDPEREESRATVRALYDVFGDHEFTVKRIIRRCSQKSALRMAMPTSVVGHQKEIDSRSLAWCLKRIKGRVLGGLRLELSRKSSGVARWRVVRVPSGYGGYSGQFPVGGDSVMRFPRLAKHR